MKNIVKINLDNNCDCDCLYSLGGNENSVNLELQHDSYVNPILALTSDIGTISITDFELVGDSLIKYQISQKYWNVDEQISLTVSDGDWISDPITFQCKAMKDCDNIRVKKLDDGYMIYPFVAGVDATGKTIKSIVEQYYLSTSPTAMLGGNWDTKYPGWENNKYIWTRSIYTYSDETTLTTTAICVTGSKGDTGDAGRGIKSAVTTFQVGASGTTIPTGTWSSSVPATSAAKPYLWSKTVTTYTDNTTSVAYSVGSTPEGVLDKINKVLRYDDTTVVLGKTGSNATLNLKNDAVTIQKGSTPAASFTPDKLALGNGYFEIECIPDDTGAKKIVNLKSIDSLVQAMELHIFNTENTDSAAMYLSQVELPSGVGAASKGTGIGISAEHIFFKPKRSLTYDIPVLTDDCNNLTASGKYYLSDKSTNRPVNKNGWLECMKYSTNYCFQKYITYDGEEYTRLMQAGTWGGWSYASGWKSLGTWNSVGNKTVNNLSLYNEICYIMGYANTLQCQETGILPMSYFQTGRNILVRDAANGQNFEFKYVNATTINIGSVTNGNWGLALYVK